MEDPVPTPLPPLSVAGIDVSAEHLQVAWGAVDAAIEEATFDNTPEGHKKLLAMLTKKRQAVRIIVEATGLYSLDLCLFLAKNKHVALMVCNPKSARDFGHARLRRAKTDKVDARLLREYGLCMPFQPWQPPAPHRLAFRTLARRIQDLVDHKTAEQNRLAALTATAQAPEPVLDDLRQAIVQLDERIETLRQEAIALADADPDLREARALIKTIKGFADQASVLLLGELALLPADLTPRQLVAHAGLDPRPFQTGHSRNPPRKISKVGNAAIRAALYMPALTAVRWEPAVRAFYEHLTHDKNKLRLVALTAVMRKLLTAIWAMITHKTPFDGARFGNPQRATT